MLPNEKLRRSYSVPGKVFLLGEYAALAGFPAVVVAAGGRFRLSGVVSSVEQGHRAVTYFEAKSPAGKLASELIRNRHLPDLDIKFEDVMDGCGGLGASTAQFALLHRLYSDLISEFGWGESLPAVWPAYRLLTADESLPPSGADLVGQVCGGVTCFSMSAADGKKIESLNHAFDWSCLRFFLTTVQPGRKTATHEHLRKLAMLPKEQKIKLVEALQSPLNKGLNAIRVGDPSFLGKSMVEYAQVLNVFGLEHSLSEKDRLDLMTVPGVLGVKGCGALLSDVLAICFDKQESVAQVEIDRLIHARGYREIQIDREGIRREV